MERRRKIDQKGIKRVEIIILARILDPREFAKAAADGFAEALEVAGRYFTPEQQEAGNKRRTNRWFSTIFSRFSLMFKGFH